MNKIRVIELFAGYGSQHLALKRLKRDYPEFEYEVVAFCEIDENAIKAYHALHGDHIPNLGDITQVNPSDVPDCDLMTWSFPCQSISSAGLQHGLAEGSGTRSSLCWNAMRIFEAKRPKYLLMENVSALVSDKFIGDFNLLQSSLQKIGYTNFTQLMNAKDYGVPQNRLRVFMVSVLDCSQAYYFPKPFPLEKRLKDVLETNVPDRYYLSQERLAGLKLSNEKAGDIQIVGAYNKGQSGVIDNAAGCSPTVDAAANSVTSVAKDSMIVEPAILQQQRTEEGKEIRRQHKGDKGIPYAHKELTPRGDGISNTLSTVEKDNLLAEPTIIDTTNSCFEHGGITQHENISPTLRSQRTGLLATEPAIIEDFYPDRPARVYEEQAPTIRSDRTGLKVTEPAVEQVGQLYDKASNPQYGRIYNSDGLSPTLVSHGSTQGIDMPKVIEPTRQDLIQYHLTDDGNLRAYIDDEKKTGVSELQITNPDNPAPTLTGANHAKVWQSIEEIIEQAKTAHPSRGIIMIKNTPCWVRRLTERELFRLMDVDENDIDTLLNAGISNTQLAKLAGNSVVCACYYHIFRKLFIDTNANENEQLQLF